MPIKSYSFSTIAFGLVRIERLFMKKWILLLAVFMCFMPMTIESVYADETQTVDISYNELANITFYDDGIMIQEKINCGDILKEPSHVEKDGYRFLGWYIKGTDEKWDFLNPVTNHLDLESRFEKIKTEPEKEDTKKDETKKREEKKTSSKSKGVNTSDKTYVACFGTLLVVSLGSIYFLVRKKRAV